MFMNNNYQSNFSIDIFLTFLFVNYTVAAKKRDDLNITISVTSKPLGITY